MTLNLKKFDFSTVKPHRIKMILGRRGCGKSVLQRYICYLERHLYHYGIGICRTNEQADFYRSIYSPGFTFNNLPLKLIDTLMRIGLALDKKGKPRFSQLSVDDCGFDKTLWRNKVIREFFMNGRHSKMSGMFNMQYINDFPPDLRENVDYLFIFANPSREAREKLRKIFFGMFSNDDFARVMDRCTNDYEFLVLDQTSTSNAIEDRVFWGKAELHIPAFRITKPIYWLMSEIGHKPDEAENILDDTMSEIQDEEHMHKPKIEHIKRQKDLASGFPGPSDPSVRVI